MKSFDFDGTLQGYDGKPIQRVIDLIDEDSIIVTRQEPNPDTKLFALALNIPVYFTSGEWKWKKLKELGVTEHYDDDPTEIELIKKNTDIKTHFVDDDKSDERQVKLKKTKFKSKKVLIVDHGTLVGVALRLSQDFGTTFYFCPWKKDYSKTCDLQVGEGFEEIKWVLHFWDCIRIEKPDLVIFTGVIDGDLQEQLIDMDIPVWGSREAECMEIYRWEFLEYMMKIGLPTPPSKKVIGIDALRKELYKDDKTKWVKQDANERGNGETFRYIEPEATELSIIGPLERDLRSGANDTMFIIQEPIDATVETGYDGYVIDGKFPKKSMFGIEVKDMGYVMEIRDYEELPESVKFVNSKLAPSLKKYGMRGSIHTEIKEGKDGDDYLLDMTMRMGYPPTHIITTLCTNLAEVYYEGARGNLIEPIYSHKFACEIMLFSDYAKEEDYKLIVPDEIKEWVKQPYIYRNKNGSIINIPQPVKNNNVGSVIAVGDSIEECTKLAIERAEMLDGHGLTFDIHCLDKAIEQLKKL